MVWCLEAYDTEMREARSRRYTTGDLTAEAWERIPRIDFTDSGHGIVFHALEHPRGKKRKPEIQPFQYDDKLREARRELQRERRQS